MRKSLLSIATTFFLLFGISGKAQKILFKEYDLDNGLHVILHKDTIVPVVTTGVMYHVGSKNEDPNRTGFAHFFEHLLFEGTKNIPNGSWFKIVSSNGGKNNANTTSDRTYYYETFPSNALELALWMESERMLHPVIDKSGVDTQNEVVKEERRLRVDNAPYGRFEEYEKKHLFKKHPYRWTTIGNMAHLDSAKLEEFIAFNEKFYVPNNATLVVAGNIDIEQTKEWIEKYFAAIPKGTIAINREFPKEDPIEEEIRVKEYDPNIQIPAMIISYRTPSQKSKDSRVIDFIDMYLSSGKSSKLYKKMVDNKKISLQVGSFNYNQEDYSSFYIYALPLGNNSLDDLLENMEEEIAKIRKTSISTKSFKKLQNKMEMAYVNANSTMQEIANSLARYHVLYGDTNLINKEIEIYRSITPKDIKEVANKYLKPSQRIILEYLPKLEK